MDIEQIEQAEEHIDDCLAALDRAVPTRDFANREFWACVIDYLGRYAEYLREEVAEGIYENQLGSETEV